MSNPDESRARLERLIAAADRVAQQPVPPAPPARPPWLPFAAVALAGLGVILVGVKLASRDDGNVDNSTTRTTTLPTSVQTVPASTSLPIVITLPPQSIPVSSTTTPGTTSSTTPPASTTTWVQPPMQPVRSTSYEAGTFVLTGAVPDQATSDALVARFAAGAGMDHVVARHTIAAAAPLVDEEPLLAHDAIQFPPNSAQLQPPAIEFLDVLAEVLRANPSVTIDIRGYTDGAGNPASNLTLSQNRVDAIAFHLVSKGIAPERLTATGYGSAFPVAPDDTEAGRAKNRRVEFTLHHLLG